MELISNAASVQLPPRLSPETMRQLAIDVRSALESESRIVQLAAAGDDVFCTGLALDSDPASVEQTQEFAAVLHLLATAPKPTLAIVQGQAFGGGMGLAAACDWVIASTNASFGLPELLWGVIPAMIWPFLVDRMSESAARRWTISAATRPASEALAAGLADEVVEPSALDATAGRAVRRLLRLEPNALARLRTWTRTVRNQNLQSILLNGAALTTRMAAEPRVRERWQAFQAGEAPWL